MKHTSALPVYINYGKSMHLEPAFHKRGDAAGIFEDWLAARVITEFAASVDEQPPDLAEMDSRAREFVNDAEQGRWPSERVFPGTTILALRLEEWARNANRERVVLLMDDAAHAFVPEQQEIFFEWVRTLRTRRLTYKAAIYPGATGFSRNFNVGHDAKIIDAWIQTDRATYLPFMREIFQKRVGDYPKGVSEEVVDLFAAAAFGNPRGFLSMIEQFLLETPSHSRTQSKATQIINAHATHVHSLFRQLEAKFPAYRNYVAAGELVLGRMIGKLGSLNQERRGKAATHQAVEVLIRRPVGPKLDTILKLLEYSGCVRTSEQSVKYGDGTQYFRVGVHGALLMANAAVNAGRTPSLSDRANSVLRGPLQYSGTRASVDAILDPRLAETCVLEAGVCSNCGKPRTSLEARYCPYCGNRFGGQSRYEDLIKAPIEALDITPLKKKRLSMGRFSVVGDVLADQGLERLQKIQSVGPIWARRIMDAAEEFVSV